jgi:GAF domain-containing protein
MNRKLSFSQSGSLSLQLTRRVLSLGVVAVLGLLALVAVALFSSFQATQTQLDVAGDAAHDTFTEFLGGLNDDLRSTSDALTTTSDADEVFLRTLRRQPAIFELNYVDPTGKVLTQRRRVGQAETLFTEQPWLEVVQAGNTYVGSVDYGEFGVPFVTVAVPVTDRTGDFKGTLLALTDLTALWRPLINLEVGESGYAYIVDDAGQLLAYKDLKLVQSGLKVESLTGHTPQSMMENDTNVYSGLDGETVIAAIQPLDIAPWFVVVEQPISEAFRAFAWISVVLIGLLIFVILQAVSVRRFTQRRIVEPLGLLRTGVQELLAGQKIKPIILETRDELGELASTFNSMASQLQESISTLEQRVADRTRALATSSEVSRRLSTILDQNELVAQVVNQVNSAFGYYHTQIYFFDANKENLVMAGGTGEAGRMMLEQFHKLARGRGLVGRAAQTNEPILVADTTQNPEWLPNPLLPDTKSEAAIPISVGDLVLGVLDVQHSVSDGLKREDIDALQSIANQVAVALQNTRSYTEIQRSQLLLSEALKISRLANWEYDLEQDLFTFNDQFYSIFRTSADKVGGYKLSSADYARLFVHPEDAPLVGSEIQKTIDNRDRRYSAALEHRIIFSDGQIGYISVRITVERDENGNVLRWYGANQDITERRTLEEVNRRRAIEQEAINLVTQKIQSTTNVEAALQVAARELGHVLGRRQTLIALNPVASADNGKANVTK